MLAENQFNCNVAWCCLFMVHVIACMPNGERISAYAFPWDCLTTAARFAKGGAERVTLCSRDGSDHWWTWRAPEKPRRRSKHAQPAPTGAAS